MQKLLQSLLLLTPFIFATPVLAQDDLLAELEAESKPETEYTFATFKGTRIVNLQSNELPGKGVLQYMILHRFGSFQNDFFHNFLGLHNAQVRLTLDYGVTDWLNVGIGQSSFNKMYDGFVKYRLLRQSTGKRNMPVSVTGFSSIFYTAQRYSDDFPRETSTRLSFVHELVVARKFSKRFSAEIVPTVVHYNLTERADQDNDVFAIGLGGRYKLTNMHAISVEYVHQLNPFQIQTGIDANGNAVFGNSQNALSVGFDIETGGHVFQLFLTNSRGVSDPLVFTQTPGDWLAGDIHFGFNISRVFTIVRPKEFKE
jgi:hypothetical protein